MVQNALHASLYIYCIHFYASCVMFFGPFKKFPSLHINISDNTANGTKGAFT